MIRNVRITAKSFVNRWIRGNKSLISAKYTLKRIGFQCINEFSNLAWMLKYNYGRKERPPFQPTPKKPVPSALKDGGDAYWGNQLYLPFSIKEVQSMSPEQLSYAERWARGNKVILYRFLGKALYTKIFKEDAKKLFGEDN